VQEEAPDDLRVRDHRDHVSPTLAPRAAQNTLPKKPQPRQASRLRWALDEASGLQRAHRAARSVAVADGVKWTLLPGVALTAAARSPPGQHSGRPSRMRAG
jgi:hypothetical protein